MTTLHFRNIKKNYGKQTIMENINFEIAAGEFIVLVGPSGCGKSTLLRMAAGLETVTGGEILINDIVVNKQEPKDRKIAMVFQNYALYPHMSAYDNIAYSLKIQGLSKEIIQEKVHNVADILELRPLLASKPSQMSGGQRQRVAMGRAIVRDPKIFLFDEPLSNLDAKLRAQMRLEIQKLHQRLKITSLYVTHDQVEAMTLATRMIVMNKGRIEQIGAPFEVYKNPLTKFVANFIGSPAMNFMQFKVQAQGILSDGIQSIHLPIYSNNLKLNQLVDIGVRPEHLHISALTNEHADEHTDAHDIESLNFSGKIRIIEQLGADTLLHIDIGHKDYLVQRLSSTHGYHIDQLIKLNVQAEYLYVFDAASGHRILNNYQGD